MSSNFNLKQQHQSEKALEELQRWGPSWAGPQAAPPSARPRLFSVPDLAVSLWVEVGVKVEVMLDGVSFKDTLFSWSHSARVHVEFVDGLAPTAKTGFLTDLMGDQVAAAARLVGAGACMDVLAEAEPKRRRRGWGGGGGFF